MARCVMCGKKTSAWGIDVRGYCQECAQKYLEQKRQAEVEARRAAEEAKRAEQRRIRAEEKQREIELMRMYLSRTVSFLKEYCGQSLDRIEENIEIYTAPFLKKIRYDLCAETVGFRLDPNDYDLNAISIYVKDSNEKIGYLRVCEERETVKEHMTQGLPVYGVITAIDEARKKYRIAIAYYQTRDDAQPEANTDIHVGLIKSEETAAELGGKSKGKLLQRMPICLCVIKKQ